jgi:hypothetical protein
MVGFSDEIATKKVILDYYKLYKSNSLIIKTESVEKYSRKSLTEQLAILLNLL